MALPSANKRRMNGKAGTPTVSLGDRKAPIREPHLAQIASFVGFFVWLLTLKTFFLPLFIIPTGSMAESLRGAHAAHTCANCGREYEIGFRRDPVIFSRGLQRIISPGARDPRPEDDPIVVRCPNCRWEEPYRAAPLAERLQPTAGDRIVVHGWPFVFGGSLGPRRWDVVVFKNPSEPQVNYIKRLIGLPGEKIEIIDGDIFVNDRIARKTRAAQRSLWFPYYDHDHFPRAPGRDGYLPRWVAVGNAGAWSQIETRAPQFEGASAGRAEIGFFTTPENQTRAGVAYGEIGDVYGYNQPGRTDMADDPLRGLNVVRDVRLSVTVAIAEGEGYVELRTTKFTDGFIARLYGDGRVTLEREKVGTQERELWGEQRIAPPRTPVSFALANADYQVSVEIDGAAVVSTTPDRYDVQPGPARQLATSSGYPVVRIAAERVRASFTHLLIERDIYYTNGDFDRGRPGGNGVMGRSIQLGPAAYFVLGDNSPASQDSRYWTTYGPHLKDKDYQIGTVPADQMIGRAFLVYWPGFLPLYTGGSNLLPDAGRVRWIH